MGLFDAIKGLLGSESVQGIINSEGVQGILESTGLGDTVGGLLGEGTEVAENFGVDVGQVTESLGVDGIAEALPGGVGDAIDPAP